MQEEMTKEEREYLEKLERALEDARVPKWLYSIGGSAEKSFCIEKKDSKWIYFWSIYPNYKIYNLEEFDSVEEAGNRLISSVSFNNEEIEYLEKLKRALEDARVSYWSYSIGGYAEESFCIEKKNSKWIYYWGEHDWEDRREKKRYLEEFDSVEEAGKRLISMVSDSNKEEMTKDEVEYLKKIRGALKDVTGDGWFAIGGYAEEYLSIEKKNSKWIIYLGERGHNSDLEQFDSVEEAVDRLIYKNSDSNRQEAKVKKLVRKK